MFENCNSLLELNLRRLELIRSMRYDLKEINASYMQARNNLSIVKKSYKKVTCHRPTLEEVVPYMGIPYVGEPPKELTVVITKEGFLL